MPLDLARRHAGQVHVEEHVWREALDRGDLSGPGCDDRPRYVGSSPRRGPRTRSRCPGMPSVTASIAAGDGAGIQHVLAHVRAVIDAGEDEVGPLRHQAPHRQQHAVGRRAVHLERAVAAPAGRSGRWSVREWRSAALFPVGRDHGDGTDLAAASASTAIPGASMPSSLLTRMFIGLKLLRRRALPLRRCTSSSRSSRSVSSEAAERAAA